MHLPKALPWALTMTAIAGASWFVHQQRLETQQLREGMQQLHEAQTVDAERLRAVSKSASQARTLAIDAQREMANAPQGEDVSPGLLREHPGAPTEDADPSEVTAGPAEDGKSTAPGSAPLEMVAANIEAHFESDVVDVMAAQSVETIRQHVTPMLGEGSTIESIDCRETMCRLESTQDTFESYRQFISQVTRSDACRECFFTQTGETEDQRPKLTLYMARNGHPLPRLE